MKELRKINAYITLIIDEPENRDFEVYCDHFLINKKRIGFGKARKLSLLLASEFSEYCIVTDGDGQYPIESIKQVLEELYLNKFEVIIPQRINKKLLLNFSGTLIDRNGFELLENLCALEMFKKKSNIIIDVQPGMFGFKSSIIQKILPEDNEWLADFEITTKAINDTNYQLINVPINEEIQLSTSFSLKSQINKIKNLIETKKCNVSNILEKNKNLFKDSEIKIIEDILKSIIISE